MSRRRLLAVAVAAAGIITTGPGIADAAAAGRYIVVLEQGAAQTPGEAAQAARAQGAKVSHVYRHALRGYSATLPDALLAKLRRSSAVADVVRDGTVEFFDTQSPTPSYGIDRIDQRNRPLSNSYTYNATAAGVDAYIIDTGINRAHQDFGGRAVSGIDYYNGGEVEDCQGHGTHVAGTVGGTSYGVAKGVRLIGVRIGDCSTSINTSTAISGIDWVTGNHTTRPAVANLSFGGGTNSAMDTAVRNMIADGVVAAIAAGNGNILGQAVDACGTSPGRVAEAITVGATTSTDAKASYSNYGTCLDIFAPGSSIVSASSSSNTGSATLSGTSMAAPHVAGAAAMYLQQFPSAKPADVAAALKANATQGVVTSPGSGSPNLLLYNGFISAGGTTPEPTPTPTPTPTATPTTTPTPTPTPGTDPDPATPTLTSGTTTSSTSSATGGWKYFKIAVPTGRSSLNVVLDGPACGLFSCAADLDLFVKKTSKPTTTSFNCSAETGSSDESCSVANPGADYWYVGVYTYSGSSGASFTIKATY